MKLKFSSIILNECFTSLAVSCTAAPFGARVWIIKLLMSILSPPCPIFTPSWSSNNSQSSRVKQRLGEANSGPWVSKSKLFSVRVSLNNSDDTRTIAEYVSGFEAPSPWEHLICLELKKAWRVSAALLGWRAVGLITCEAFNQSTVSVFKGKLKQLVCKLGNTPAASSSPRKLESERMSEQFTVRGKDASPAAATGSDTSNVSPGQRLRNGKEKWVEGVSSSVLEVWNRGKTAMLRVQPRSRTWGLELLRTHLRFKVSFWRDLPHLAVPWHLIGFSLTGKPSSAFVLPVSRKVMFTTWFSCLRMWFLDLMTVFSTDALKKTTIK